MQPNIIPIIQYADAPAAVEWLVRSLGFAVQRADLAADAAVARAELRFGASALVVIPAATARPSSAARTGIHLCAPDLTDTITVHDSEGYLWSRGPGDFGAGDGEVSIVAERRYRSLTSAIAWLRDALGFETTFEVPGPAGEPRHVEMRLGAGTIYVGPLSGEQGAFADIAQFVNLVVDDPDGHHARAKAAGANIVLPPSDTPFGARFYAARDGEDVLWWVSTYRPAVPTHASAHR